MDMHFFHFSMFTLQLLISGAVALFTIEMYRLTSPALATCAPAAAAE